MFCRKCAQPLIPDAEKALATGEVQEVWRSTLTQDWICKVDGDEHEPGTLHDWARRVQTTLYGIQSLMDEGEVDAETALNVVLIDAGLVERSDWAARLGKALRSEDPAQLQAILNEEEEPQPRWEAPTDPESDPARDAYGPSRR